jgi:hypothetical protein
MTVGMLHSTVSNKNAKDLAFATIDLAHARAYFPFRTCEGALPTGSREHQ